MWWVLWCAMMLVRFTGTLSLDNWCFLVLGLFRIVPWFTALMVYILSMNLFFRGIELSNGGYHLVSLELFYLVFLALFSVGKSNWSWLRNTVANLAYWAIWIQICVVYATAGFYKLTGQLWESGDAMYYVLSIPEYSHPWIMERVNDLKGILMVGTWLVLAYQVLFPFLIWIRKVRPVLLLCGFLFHLGIVLAVGIMDFGIIMIFSYLIFLPDHLAKKWLQRVQKVVPGPLKRYFTPTWPASA